MLVSPTMTIRRTQEMITIGFKVTGIYYHIEIHGYWINGSQFKMVINKINNQITT